MSSGRVPVVLDDVTAKAPIGELIYIAINSVPQICYVLSALIRYMTKATEAHFNYAKGGCRYLKGVKERRINPRSRQRP